MARVDLTINAFTRGGVLDPTPESVTAANDAMFANDGRTVLRITNGAVGTATLGFISTAEVSSLAISTTRWYGPFETGLFNQLSADAGKVYVDTDVTVTITAFRLP